MSESHNLDQRVAVLEQIAKDTATALVDIRTELRGMRTELRSEMQQQGTQLRTEIQGLRGEIQQLRGQSHDDFRWLLQVMIGGFVGTFGLLGHIAHWF